MFGKFQKIICFLIAAFVGLLLWFSSQPDGVTLQAWHLFAIFIFTILGIILKAMPMGAMTLIALTCITATKTLTISEAFSGFGGDVVWLIVIAFFIAKGFMKTGLGSRVAYGIMSCLGKNTLGIGYGIVATDLILAPAIPSLTARSGGVIFPVISSISKAFGSEPHNHPRKLGSYLFQTAFQGSCITSAMFLTAMAGNPLIADIAAKAGVNLTWGTWALAASVPGLVCLLLVPFLLYKLYPPEMQKAPEAQAFSKKMLKEMGPMSLQEWVMIAMFILLLALWIAGPFIKMNATIAALIAISFLIITDVLTWEEIIKEKAAWDTLVWFSTLTMMAAFLSKLGLSTWFSQWVVTQVRGFSWESAFVILSAVYFFSHYFFASNVAHIGAMFSPFMVLSIALGAPPMLVVLTLAFYSSLFGGLTHYGCGPAPILFGAGYVKLGQWWKFGFIFGVFYFLIWMFLGGAWWKLLHLI